MTPPVARRVRRHRCRARSGAEYSVQADADQCGKIAARDLRQAEGSARNSSGRRIRAPCGNPLRLSVVSGERIRARGIAIRGSRARVVPTLLEQFAGLRERDGVSWIECDRMVEVLQRRRGVAAAPLDSAELPVQDAAVDGAPRCRLIAMRASSSRPAFIAVAQRRSGLDLPKPQTSMRAPRGVSEGSALTAASKATRASLSRPSRAATALFRRAQARRQAQREARARTDQRPHVVLPCQRNITLARSGRHEVRDRLQRGRELRCRRS